MALMIPKLASNFSGSLGERMVYASLEELEDEFVIFHSFNWRTKDEGYFKEGEGDLIVYDPRYGLLVVEIKSGGIRVSEGQWYQQDLSTKREHHLLRSPLAQADDTRWTIINLLKRNKVNVQVYSAIWFTAISKQNTNLDDPHVHEDVVFWKEDLDNPKRALKKAFEYYNVVEKDYDPDLRRKVINVLAPEFNAMPTGKDLIDFNESNFVRMTSEQARVLDFLIEQQEAAIMGSAGTGKTLLAVEKAKRLSKNGRVLLLCFNLFLIEDLAERVKNYSNIEVHNIYTFAQKYLAFKEDEYDLEKITESLLEFDINEWPFDHVVIDEGQDINPDHVMLLKHINDINEEGFFYVFYDENQTVQQREELSWRRELACQLVLGVNCRNTKNIAETSHSVLENKRFKVKSDIDGDKATFVRVSNQEELLNEINETINRYIEEGYQRQDITILTHKTLERSLLNGINKIGNHSLDMDNRLTKRVFFTTARKFKGLESPILILIDLDKNSFDTLENRRLFYVASSRAKTNLNLIFSGTEEEYIEFMGKNLESESKYIKLEFAQKMNVTVI